MLFVFFYCLLFVSAVAAPAIASACIYTVPQ